MRTLTTRHPWRTGLVISTLLTALFFCASMMWQAGYAQWAFALAFVALWALVSLLLVNDEFNENSGLLLAGIIDENVDHLLERIQQLEQKLALAAERDDGDSPQAIPPPGEPAASPRDAMKKAPGNVSN